MQANSAVMISEFAKRFSTLESENQSLKARLESEIEAHATTKALLSNVLKEINTDPDKIAPGEPLMNDMKIFAEKSILFCDQMRAFASHVLQKHEQRVALLSQDRCVSPALSCKASSKTVSPERREESDLEVTHAKRDEQDQEAERDLEAEPDQIVADTPGSEAPTASWSHDNSDIKVDADSKALREQLGRFGRELERLLHDHSDRIELQSLARLYHRRYRRDLPSFPHSTFEEILNALPGQEIRIESNEQGDFLVLLSQHRARFSRSNFYRQDRSDRARRSRSRSPRASRHTSRGRSRSHERYPRSSSKHEEGSRPARSYYRFARSPEGTLVCIYFNSRTCPNKPCNYAHICGNCGKASHGMRSCPLQQDSANDNATQS